MTAPTLVAYAETTWTGSGAKSTPSVSWAAGDIIVVLAQDSNASSAISAPAATGLTFTAGGAVGTSGADCQGASWSAAPVASGSSAVSSTCATFWGMAVWVWRGSAGLGNRATSITAAKTVSLTRSGANSCVCLASGDFAAAAVTGYAFTPAVANDRQHVQEGTAYSVYVADFGDQGSAGTTSYGTAGETSAGPFTNVAVEVLGTASSAVSSADTASGSDSGERAAVGAAETAHGADAAEIARGPAPSRLAGLLALSSAPPAGPAASAETAQGADAGTAIRLSSAETAQGTEPPGTVAAAVSGPESALGTESAGTVAAHLPAAEAAQGADGGEAVSTGPHVSDSDSVHAEDSGFAVVAGAEAAQGADGGEAVLLAPVAPETVLAAERELRSWPADPDSATAAESGYWSGPVKDAEAVSAAEAAVTVGLSDSGVFPRGDSCLVTDAAGPGSGQVRVYAFQPPFRWTGGGFALHFGGRAVWSGPRPDAAAYELWQRLDGTAARLVTDADSAAAAEEHDPALVSASAAVRPAVAVTVTVGRW